MPGNFLIGKDPTAATGAEEGTQGFRRDLQIFRKVGKFPGIQLLDGYGICRAERQAMAAESAVFFIEGPDLIPFEYEYGGAGRGAVSAGDAFSLGWRKYDFGPTK